MWPHGDQREYEMIEDNNEGTSCDGVWSRFKGSSSRDGQVDFIPITRSH